MKIEGYTWSAIRQTDHISYHHYRRDPLWASRKRYLSKDAGGLCGTAYKYVSHHLNYWKFICLNCETEIEGRWTTVRKAAPRHYCECERRNK